MSKIKKYDSMVQKINEELNDDLINKYNEDTVGPIMLLEEKSFQIKLVKERHPQLSIF